MLNRTTYSSTFFALCLTTASYADFLPPNDLHLQDDIYFSGGLTEAQFNQVLDQVETAYAPIIKALGGKLKMNRYWTDSTVNASANQSGSTWHVNMYGGLARRSEVTVDGFTMVVCHELGHHVAGFPYVQSWAANEGQSDYFAPISCARLLWGVEADKNAEARDAISDFPQKLCDDNNKERAARDLCYRQMLANESIAGLLAALKGDQISYETPDKTVVSKTNGKHPAAQCRFDTYIAATLCPAVWNHKIIPRTEQESAKYTCARQDGHTYTARPHCWFKEGY